MKLLPLTAATSLAIALCIGGSALAQPWENDDDQEGWHEYHEAPRYDRREHRDHYGRGDCRVKGKWKHGEYVEEVKCKKDKHHHYRYEPD